MFIVTKVTTQTQCVYKQKCKQELSRSKHLDMKFILLYHYHFTKFFILQSLNRKKRKWDIIFWMFLQLVEHLFQEVYLERVQIGQFTLQFKRPLQSNNVGENSEFHFNHGHSPL